MQESGFAPGLDVELPPLHAVAVKQRSTKHGVARLALMKVTQLVPFAAPLASLLGADQASGQEATEESVRAITNARIAANPRTRFT